MTHHNRLVLGLPVSCRLASMMAKSRLPSPHLAATRKKNGRIMFVASCALLLAAANGFYAPATRHPLARAKPLQAAKEGVAAPGEKQRIARRSVRKEGQPSKRIDIHGDTQKSAQQFNAHAPCAPFPRRCRTRKHTHRSSSAMAWSASASSSSAPTSSRSGARDRRHRELLRGRRLQRYNRG